MTVGSRSTFSLATPQQHIAAAREPSLGTCSSVSPVLHSLSPFPHGRDIRRAARGDANAPPHLRSKRRGQPRVLRGRLRRLRRSGRIRVSRAHPLDQPTDELRRCARRVERSSFLNPHQTMRAGMVQPCAADAVRTTRETPRRSQNYGGTAALRTLGKHSIGRASGAYGRTEREGTDLWRFSSATSVRTIIRRMCGNKRLRTRTASGASSPPARSTGTTSGQIGSIASAV